MFDEKNLMEAQDRNDALKKENNELEGMLRDSMDENKKLEDALRAGATPACLYESPGGYYGGGSLSLGAVYIEENQIKDSVLFQVYQWEVGVL